MKKINLVLSDGAKGEGAGAFKLFSSTGFYEQYVRDGIVIDFGYKGGEDFPPIFPEATGIDLDTPGYDGEVIPMADSSVGTIIASHVLEHIADYGGFLREAFRVLKINGTLILTVPMKDVYERKEVPPSSFNPSHLRFYTCMRLTFEIETQLNRDYYKIVYLAERFNDESSFSVEKSKHASFPYEIVCVLEKIGEQKEDNLTFLKRTKLVDYFIQKEEYSTVQKMLLLCVSLYGTMPKNIAEIVLLSKKTGGCINVNSLIENIHLCEKAIYFLGRAYVITNKIDLAVLSILQVLPKMYANCTTSIMAESIYILCHGRKSDNNGFNLIKRNLNSENSIEKLVSSAFNCKEYLEANRNAFAEGEHKIFEQRVLHILYVIFAALAHKDNKNKVKNEFLAKATGIIPVSKVLLKHFEANYDA